MRHDFKFSLLYFFKILFFFLLPLCSNVVFLTVEYAAFSTKMLSM